MKINIKTNVDDIIIICLYITFIVTSYASYIPIPIIDDIMIFLIGMILIYKIIKKGFSKNMMILLIVIIILELFFTINAITRYTYNSINSIISFVKVCVLLVLPYYFNLKNKDKILKNFVILSIPNLLLGVLQLYQTFIKEVPLVGKYEPIGGKYFYRLQGGTGHPLYYGLIMIAIILYFLYNSKFKHKNIMVVICIILCALTYSTFTLAIAIAIIAFKIFSKWSTVINILQKYSKTCVIIAIVLSMFVVYKYMFNETNTIRYVSTISTIQAINFKTFFIGRGFGSYLASNFSEAYIFRIIYENGIIGLALFVYILFNLLLKQIPNNNFSGMFICFIYILNIFINEGYLIPYIILIPIFCSNTMDSKRNTELIEKDENNISKINTNLMK